MKPFKLVLALVAVAPWLRLQTAQASVAPYSNTYYTYDFTANPGYPTAFNASTVTIDAEVPYLGAPTVYSVSGYYLTDGTYTLNSSLLGAVPGQNESPGYGGFEGITFAGTSGFTGTFEFYDETSFSQAVAFEGISTAGGAGSLDSYYGVNNFPHDPPGTWSFGPLIPSVPDESNTLALLGETFAALAGVVYWKRRSTASARI